MTSINLFSDLSQPHDQEMTDILYQDKGVRIERIRSWGQTSPVYDQQEHEWVTLLQGQAHILFVDEGEKVILDKGDSLFIQAGRRHQVTYTSQACLWLCCFWRA